MKKTIKNSKIIKVIATLLATTIVLTCAHFSIHAEEKTSEETVTVETVSESIGTVTKIEDNQVPLAPIIGASQDKTNKYICLIIVFLGLALVTYARMDTSKK